MGDVAPWQERDPNQEDEDDDVDENVFKSVSNTILTNLAISGSEGCHTIPNTSFPIDDQAR